jgi:hypothetical protein
MTKIHKKLLMMSLYLDPSNSSQFKIDDCPLLTIQAFTHPLEDQLINEAHDFDYRCSRLTNDDREIPEIIREIHKKYKGTLYINKSGIIWYTKKNTADAINRLNKKMKAIENEYFTIKK